MSGLRGMNEFEGNGIYNNKGLEIVLIGFKNFSLF